MSRSHRPSTRHSTSLLIVSSLLLALAVPAAAHAATPQNCGPSLAFLGAESPEAVLFGPTPMAKKGDTIDDPGAQSPCIVDCGDGSGIVCYGSYCNAYERSCPNEPGHCYGTITGTLYCGTCDCYDKPSCQDLGGTSCSGSPKTTQCRYPGFGCASCICSPGHTWTCPG